jgi:hypothetical protein
MTPHLHHGSICRDYLELFWIRDLSLVPHLFIVCSVNNLLMSVWILGYLFYMLGHNLIYSVYFCCSEWSSFGLWELFQLSVGAFAVPQHHTSGFVLFCIRGQLIFFGSTRIWTQVLTQARLALYHLRHAPTLFYCSYFSNRISWFFLGWPGLWYPCLWLLHIWDHWHIPPHVNYWLRWGFTNFLPNLTWNCDPPDLCLLSNWDYRR